MLDQKQDHQVKSKENLVYTLEGTVFIKISQNFVRLLISIKSRSEFKLGHIGSKTRLPSRIIENVVYTLEGTVLIQRS